VHREEPTDPQAIGARLRALRSLPLAGEAGHAVAAASHLALVALAIWAWSRGHFAFVACVWCAIAWMDHAALTRLHEAAHGALSRSRVLNEAQGILIGTLALTPLSVYRFVHARHHACLGREGDPEFWPYNDPKAPRALRVAYAWAELAFGWILTPALYSLRTARAWRRVPASQHGRLVGEWIFLAGFWAATLAVVASNGWWEWFVVAHLAPAWLAGSMQTIRKFTEHLGMHGASIVSMTRTVVYRGPVGRAASASQLHVEHHAAHHRHARIPHYALPEATELVHALEAGGRRFPTHAHAVLDMLPHLADPKLGPQWTANRRQRP
jgi:fatty acid desaturase